MCLKPKKIVNPARFVDVTRPQPLYINVPCGHCSECITSYRSEWRNRAYFEVLDTFSQSSDSYVYFDCLTYRNGCLPHVSDFCYHQIPRELDFACFNRHDVQLFMKRLRRYLEYRGYDVANNLRFFAAGEYGSDIRYSKRPHIHLLFFVRGNVVPWDVLSKAVAKNWHFGRTDGLPWKSRSYVRENVFGDRYSSVNRVCSYVTKYVTKDFGYSDLVSSRLHSLLQYDFGLYEQVKDEVRLFHYQSKSFGHRYFDSHYGASYLLDRLSIPVVNKDGVTIHVSPHRSLVRHCLQKVSRKGKRVKWLSTPEFVEYNVRIAPSRISRLASKLSGGDPFKYVLMLPVAETVLYRNFRFGDVSTVSSVCSNEHNDFDVGLRNYASKDYEFVQKRVFAYSDHGSVSDGFDRGLHLRFVDGLPSKPDELTWFSNVEKLCYYDSHADQVWDDYVTNAMTKPDDGISVMRMVERINFIHKSKLIL